MQEVQVVAEVTQVRQGEVQTPHVVVPELVSWKVPGVLQREQLAEAVRR